MENEDGQLRAKENIYSKNSKNDKKFNKKRFGLWPSSVAVQVNGKLQFP